jgi:hypothetical protein
MDALSGGELVGMSGSSAMVLVLALVVVAGPVIVGEDCAVMRCACVRGRRVLMVVEMPMAMGWSAG